MQPSKQSQQNGNASKQEAHFVTVLYKTSGSSSIDYDHGNDNATEQNDEKHVGCTSGIHLVHFFFLPYSAKQPHELTKFKVFTTTVKFLFFIFSSRPSYQSSYMILQPHSRVEISVASDEHVPLGYSYLTLIPQARVGVRW